MYDTASEPDGALLTACGNRRETVCPPCSQVYKRDARQLVRAGLTGGKGIPETVAAHPCVFATFTAPSFGPVHARRMRGKTVLPCRPRRDANARRCPHGRDISCPRRHADGDPRLGRPLCPDCYDYHAAVLFNACAGELWRRFTTYLPRCLARLAGLTHQQLRAVASVRYVKVAEYQARGVIHYHAIIRLDAPGDDYQPPPPRLSAQLLCDAITTAAATVSVDAAPAGHPQVMLRFGQQVDPRPIRHGNGLPGTGAKLSRLRSRQLPGQIRHQSTRRARRPRPAAAHPRQHRRPVLLASLPADDHHRVAARRRPAPPRPHPAMQMGPHARLRRPLPHQIPPLLRHLRPAPPRPHRTPPTPAPPLRPTRPLGTANRRNHRPGPQHLDLPADAAVVMGAFPGMLPGNAGSRRSRSATRLAGSGCSSVREARPRPKPGAS